MAQHDQVIDNASGLAVRTDINAALAALFSSNSGTVEPTVKAAGQLWFDTTTAPGTVKIRNSANNAWITLSVLSAVDMSVGFRSGTDRWVINDQVNLAGRDLLTMNDAGTLTIQDKLNFVEVDGSVRTALVTGIGADPGTFYCVVYDAAAVEVNRWYMNAAGLFLNKGAYKIHNGTAVRAQWYAEMVAASGALRLESITNGGVLDGSAVLSAAGIGLTLAGDFYISRSGFIRSVFGWTASAGAVVQSRDAAGAIDGELDVSAAGASLIYGSHRFVTSGVVRGTLGAERSVAAGRIDIRSLNNAGVEDGYLTVSPNGGGLSYGDYFIYRGGFMRANFGFDATLGAYLRYRDAAGAVVGDMYLSALGTRLQAGGYRFESAGVLRGELSTEKSAAAGRGQWDTYTNAAVLDGQAVLNNNGIALTLTGDFFIYRGGVQRANFGWDATNAAYMRMKDAAGVLTTELSLQAATETIKQTGTDFRHRIMSSGGVERGSHGVDIANSKTYMDARDAAGALAGRLDVDAAGAKVTYGAFSNARVYDTGWFPLPNTTVGETDFPIGTTLAFGSSDANIMNRNTAIVMRFHASQTRGYVSGGAGTLLAGTWISCGANDTAVASNWTGAARRVA